MSDNAVKLLRSIKVLRGQEWPANRGKDHTFRKLTAERAEQQDRYIICGFCGKSSPLVDGPSGRAWFKAHKCHRLTVIEGGAL